MRRLLDLFCGAGGASMGYHRAGFEVVGIDIKLQPHYPFEFHQADALSYLAEHGGEFDMIAASPPCHDHSDLRAVSGLDGSAGLLDQTRRALDLLGKPYVIENVSGALMPGALVLCGTEFGLHVDTPAGRRWLARHRQFESNVFLWGAGGCCCSAYYGKIIGVYGHGDSPARQRVRGWTGYLADRKIAMGIDWMNRTELAQAIPPAYTQFIGEQIADHVQLIPVPSATNGMVDRSGQRKDRADAGQYQADNPQSGNMHQEPDDQKDNSKNYHMEFLPI